MVKSLSMERKSLKYKLTIAFTLMSIIPLLVMVYFVTVYIFPVASDISEISLVVVFSLWVSWTGYLLVRHIVTPVLDLLLEARIITEGKYDSDISLTKEGELGDIAGAVNAMTGKIRSYVSELQDYSKKTASLNLRIHKKVQTLTNLMRLGDLIGTGSSYEEIATFVAEKIAWETNKGFCVIYTRDDSGNYTLETFYNNSHRDIPVDELSRELTMIEKNLEKNECIMMDSKPLTKPWQKEFREKWNFMNLMLYPMRDDRKIIGLVAAGNFDMEEEMGEDAIEVVRAYEKELVIGRQSCRGIEKRKGMEVVDSLTGLYTRSYIEDRLEDEINRAVYYQRPCSVIILKVDDFDKYTERHGMAKGKQVLKQIGSLLNVLTVPIGKAARFDYDVFGVLLPEKNKRESINIAEDICKRIASMPALSDREDRITVSIGVGENPIDGVNAKEIVSKATRNMDTARTRGKNQVVGE